MSFLSWGSFGVLFIPDHDVFRRLGLASATSSLSVEPQFRVHVLLSESAYMSWSSSRLMFE